MGKQVPNADKSLHFAGKVKRILNSYQQKQYNFNVETSKIRLLALMLQLTVSRYLAFRQTLTRKLVDLFSKSKKQDRAQLMHHKYNARP